MPLCTGFPTIRCRSGRGDRRYQRGVPRAGDGPEPVRSHPTDGLLRCEVRFDGYLSKPDLPRFVVQVIEGDEVWAEFTIVEAVLAKGTIGSADPQDRRAFLDRHEYVAGLGLSQSNGTETVLNPSDVEAIDWMPGTLLGIYGSDDPVDIVRNEHLAQRHEQHPSRLGRSAAVACAGDCLRT